jgi:putative ABC transport system permease protein
MLALSVSLFLAFFSAAHSLELSTDRTYDKLRFLDFTLPVNNCSETSVSRIRGLPGVEGATGRKTLSSRILLDPVSVPASRSQALPGRLVGIPAEHRAEVNDIAVAEGRYLAQDRGEALLERRFAKHHGIAVGDVVRLEVGGVERRFHLVGLVSSPEYIWMATNRFDPRPMEKRFALAYVSSTDAFSLADGANINEIHVRVTDQALRDRVIRETEAILGPNLSGPAVLREEQPSHSLVLRDRRAFRSLAIFFPAVFLSLSSVTIFSTLWQLVSRQRRQIGILMSQGCSSAQLLAHYLLLGLVVGILGTGLGVVMGVPLGRLCTQFYTSILNLPFMEMSVPIISSAVLCFVSVGLSLVAAWLATRRVLGLDPVRALRMEFQEGWVPRRQISIERILPTSVRFALRNLARNPGRTLLSVLGITVSIAQIVMTLAIFDSQKRTLEYYFNSVHLYDFEATLNLVTTATDLPHVGSWPEVASVEECLRRSAKIDFQGRQIEVNVWGIEPTSDLLRLYDRKKNRVTVSHEPFLFLGPVQMSRLGVQPGDTVNVSLDRAAPDPPVYRFAIAQALHEPLAHPPKMDLSLLQRMAHETEKGVPPEGANLLLVLAKSGQRQALEERLLAEKSVAQLLSPGQMKGEVEDLLRMLNAYKSLILAFTALFALVVLLGTTTMNLLERTREFATLSCLGVSDRKLTGLLLLETVAIWLAGLVLGIPSGLVLGSQMINRFQSQLLHLDLSLSLETILLTSSVSLLICFIALGNGILRLRAIPVTAATQDRFD